MKDCNEHPDHSLEIKRINRIIGQLNGIANMIRKKEYCPNILVQTKATSAALKSLEANILEKHLSECVKRSFEDKGVDSKKKIEEIIDIFKKRLN